MDDSLPAAMDAGARRGLAHRKGEARYATGRVGERMHGATQPWLNEQRGIIEDVDRLVALWDEPNTKQ